MVDPSRNSDLYYERCCHLNRLHVNVVIIFFNRAIASIFKVFIFFIICDDDNDEYDGGKRIKIAHTHTHTNKNTLS